jgi:hypothetical protein
LQISYAVSSITRKFIYNAVELQKRSPLRCIHTVSQKILLDLFFKIFILFLHPFSKESYI